MNNKNLFRISIIYASWTGSSKEISTRICEVITLQGLQADCIDVKEQPDLSGYSAVILGGGIRGGCFHPDLIRFVKRNEKILSTIPVAYFVVCLTMKENSEANRCSASGFIHALKQKAPSIEPISVGLFGGMMNYNSFTGITKLVVKMMRLPQGDFRDWAAIEQWAIQTGGMLISVKHR